MLVKHLVVVLPVVLLAVTGCAEPESTETGAILTDRELRVLGERGRAAGSNVLLISVDTLRADHVGCYGDADARTPNIDALARSGVRFDQVVCATPITLPSHSTLMTGLDPPAHGVRLNGTFRLSDDHQTLAEVLQSSGYATAAVIGAFVLDAHYGLGQGFDHYEDDLPARAAGRDGRRFSERSADRVTDAAVAWLESHLASTQMKPFLLWVHYYDPHIPYQPPEPHAAEFAGRPYDGEIAFADAEIGRLIGFLHDRDLLDDTLIVFAGDHGEGLGDHGEETHQDLLYDSTMRVPLIFSSARLFGRGGAVLDRVAGLVDVFPTLLDLLGVDYDAGALDGRNIMTTPADADRAIYIESLAAYLDYGWAAQHGLRRVHDKLILGSDPEYFDLREDPGELRNLYRTTRAAIDLERQLERLVIGQAPDSDARVQEHRLGEEEMERLASLGYVRRPLVAPSARVDPKTKTEVVARVDRAIRLTSEGHHRVALREIEVVLSQHPNASRALYVATTIYDELGRLDEGEAALRRALELQPKPDGWVHLAWYAFQREDWEVFETALAEAGRLDPMDGGIFISRGHRHRREGRLDEALKSFEKALRIDPERSGAAALEAIQGVKAMLE
ncbi:MAG: sulfatase-like hydrolase/transferase [Acidobacteriota bacterium]